MSLPVAVTITGCDTIGILRQALYAALTFKALSEKERVALLERSAPAASDGRFEQYKTSERFDGTARNPKWLEKGEP